MSERVKSIQREKTAGARGKEVWKREAPVMGMSLSTWRLRQGWRTIRGQSTEEPELYAASMGSSGRLDSQGEILSDFQQGTESIDNPKTKCLVTLKAVFDYFNWREL